MAIRTVHPRDRNGPSRAGTAGPRVPGPRAGTVTAPASIDFMDRGTGRDDAGGRAAAETGAASCCA